MAVAGLARFDVVLVTLDPTVGNEIRTTRPCVILSPDELNQTVRTFLVAPLTTRGHAYPWRVPVRFEGVAGRIALDQIRTIDRQRVVRPLGVLNKPTQSRLLATLAALFAP
jgi:mRNA interferase MazF